MCSPSSLILLRPCRVWPLAQVGSDDDGFAVRLKGRWFTQYCTHPEHGAVDDSPLYIFDGSFADRSGSRGMRQVMVHAL